MNLVQIDRYRSELNKIAGIKDFSEIEKVAKYCRDVVTTLPVYYVGDEQVYDLTKAYLLKGLDIDTALIKVKQAIDLEYGLCNFRLLVGVGFFDIRHSGI